VRVIVAVGVGSGVLVGTGVSVAGGGGVGADAVAVRMLPAYSSAPIRLAAQITHMQTTNTIATIAMINGARDLFEGSSTSTSLRRRVSLP